MYIQCPMNKQNPRKHSSQSSHRIHAIHTVLTVMGVKEKQIEKHNTRQTHTKGGHKPSKVNQIQSTHNAHNE